MKGKLVGSGLRMMLSTEMLVPFLIGSLALAVLGSAAYQVLSNWLGTSTHAALQIGAGALLILIAMAAVLSFLANRTRPLPPLKNKTAPARHRGLILLVSNEPTCRKALEWHGEALERCWLFCSEQEQSMSIARKLKGELESRDKFAELVLIGDVFDPLAYHNEVETIYAELPSGWAEADVILDFTGMTACASVGSVLACLNEERPIQYTPGKFDPALKAVQPFDPVEVALDWSVLRRPSKAGASSVPTPAPPPAAIP